MATINNILGLRQLRAEPNAHVLRFKGGELVTHGAGINFLFLAHNTGLAEVPVDDREVPFLCHARTQDFQDVTVQGVVAFRAADPVTLARRVDFTIDNTRGHWTGKPLDQLTGLMTQLVQQVVLDYCAAKMLEQVLADGVGPLRTLVQQRLTGEPTVLELGIEIAVVRLTGMAPTAEVEKALQQKTRERISQEADEATFARRAMAVENERAIAENEMQNQIELAIRERDLFTKRGDNAREEAEQEARVAMIQATAENERAAMKAERKAADIRTVEEARVAAYKQRAEVDAEVGQAVLLARAFATLAANIGNVNNLTVTPDMLTNVVNALGAGGKDGVQ